MPKYVILIPSFNDWECLNILIPKINLALTKTNEEVNILIVNDGSTKKNNLSFKIDYLFNLPLSCDCNCSFLKC